MSLEPEKTIFPESRGNFKDDSRQARSILFKLDIHILPPLALLWLANFIDRSNIGNARISGLEEDTGLQGNQFNIALTIFYVSYLLVEVPSNLVLRRVGPNRWLPVLVIVWGLVTTLTAFVQNFAGLLTIRVFLGLCEGGLLPGMILYLSTIYKRHELQLRVGIFYASASLSGAFGGLLAFGIIHMDGVGGLAGWRWIFILEGIATILAGFLAAAVLPRDIASAKFLSQEEREFAIRRFHSDDVQHRPASNAAQSPSADEQEGSLPSTHIDEELRRATSEEEQFEMREVIRGLMDIQTWLTGLAYFGLVVGLYSFSLFLPTIISGLGYSGAQAQLRTVPPYVPATVLTVVVAYLSDKLKWRGPFILICLPLAMIGYILAITAHTNSIRYLAIFFMAAGIYPCGPCILSILPNNSSGHYKKATTTALQLAIANCAGFVATFAYTSDQRPRYIRGHTITLAFVCFAWVLIACNVAYCRWENNARSLGRREANIREYQQLYDSGKTRAPIGDRHPDFRFTL